MHTHTSLVLCAFCSSAGLVQGRSIYMVPIHNDTEPIASIQNKIHWNGDFCSRDLEAHSKLAPWCRGPLQTVVCDLKFKTYSEDVIMCLVEVGAPLEEGKNTRWYSEHQLPPEHWPFRVRAPCRQPAFHGHRPRINALLSVYFLPFALKVSL